MPKYSLNYFHGESARIEHTLRVWCLWTNRRRKKKLNEIFQLKWTSENVELYCLLRFNCMKEKASADWLVAQIMPTLMWKLAVKILYSYVFLLFLLYANFFFFRFFFSLGFSRWLCVDSLCYVAVQCVSLNSVDTIRLRANRLKFAFPLECDCLMCESRRN